MCAAANYSTPNVTDGFATLRRFRRRISSILTIPEYLTEFQLFQMKNVSVKTKNGLKSAQKNVKGRPAVKKKDVIMASEQPPQTPGKDYKYEHHTPEVEDDGWGSDFDSEHGTDDEGEFDDEYEEPQQQQPTMPHSTSHAKNRAPPITPAVSTAPIPPRRPLPREPPKVQEEYENPNASDPEDYEEPIDLTPLRPPQLQSRNAGALQSNTPARRHSPPSVPNAAPPRLPPRGKTEDTYEIDNTNGPEEDYEEPEKPTSYMGGKADRSEVVSVPSPLKPSNVAKQKTNYTKVELAKPEVKPNKSWLNPGGEGPVKPSQLREGRNPSPGTKSLQIDQPPPIPSNKSRPPVQSALLKSPASNRGVPGVSTTDKPVTAGWTGRGLPRAPEEQEIEGLYSYTWYHGDLRRDSATGKLEAKSKNGMFLVRKSTKGGSPYALSLYFGGRVYNLNIRLRPDNKYALGSIKEDEKAFSTVPALISYFQNNTLVLGGNSATVTTLKQSLPK